jgi:predicted enzyme related to lactoylglutathione lyase
VVRFEVMGEDAKLLHAFYSELFDWKVVSHGGYGIVEGEDGIPGAIGAAPGVESRVTFYVGVPDVEAALELAESLGGSRRMGPLKVRRGVELGLFDDPEGHTIGLFKAP